MTSTMPSPSGIYERVDILEEARAHLDRGRYCDALLSLENVREKIEELSGRSSIDGGDFTIVTSAKDAF